MNLKKLNEELDKLLMHELSPETRQRATDEREARYLAAQATADREKAKLDRVKSIKRNLEPKQKEDVINSLQNMTKEISFIGTNFSNVIEQNGNFIIVIKDADLEDGKLTKSAEEKLKQLLEEMSKKYGCKYRYEVRGTQVKIICEKPKIANSNGHTFADWYGADLTGQKYEGDINCAHQAITSLKGAPTKVTGHFFCNDNDLTTLEGAPKYVGGSFYCGYNHLTTLEGAPEEVDRDFRCYNNRLNSLEGAPKEVGGSFSCSSNNLTSIEDAPRKVGKDFFCTDNPNLKSLDGIGEVKGEIYSDIEK